MSTLPHLVPIEGGRGAPQSEQDAWDDAWAAGPKAIVRRAFDCYYDMVFATSVRMVDSPQDAADVAQAVFETLLARTAEVRDPAKLGGFLKACAVRTSLMLLRRRRWWRLARGRKASAAEAARFEGGGQDPSSVAAARQLLARLPPEERAIIVLKCVEECSYGEVAEILGMSVATVRRRLATARARTAKLARLAHEDDIP